MNLLVDVGNSRVKWVRDRSRWRMSVAATDGFDPAAIWGSLPAPPAVVVANVAGDDVQERIARWCLDTWGVAAIFVESRAEQLGVVNEYCDVGQLGCDRWAALLGARALTSGAAAVIDCGTAVTADALTADGRFVGGVIMPGVDLMRQSLHRRAHRIVASFGVESFGVENCGVEDSNVEGGNVGNRSGGNGVARVRPLGRSTAECLMGGATYGLVGGLERVLAEMEAILGGELEVLVTGGSAPVLVPLMRQSVIVHPDLVLQGLARIARAAT